MSGPPIAGGVDAIPVFADRYRNGQCIVLLTAYDAPSARIAESAGVDAVLVGDSGAMAVLGYPTTREISMDELLTLTRAVRRSTSLPVIGDLPFGTYEESDSQAVRTARRFVNEAGCDAVKLEGAGSRASRARAIVAAGIPVVGHVGLLPQAVTRTEDYRAAGRIAEQAVSIVRDAEMLAEAGCAAIVVEAVPAVVTELLVERVRVPVIGIGAGAAGGQVLVFHDLLGFTRGKLPRFVAQYARADDLLTSAVRMWAADVRDGRFPARPHVYGMPADELERARRALEGSGHTL